MPSSGILRHVALVRFDVAPKRRLLQEPHGVTSQKTAFLNAGYYHNIGHDSLNTSPPNHLISCTGLRVCPASVYPRLGHRPIVLKCYYRISSQLCTRFPRNGPWRTIALRDAENSALSIQPAYRWHWSFRLRRIPRSTPRKYFLVLFSVRDWDNRRTIVQLQGLDKLRERIQWHIGTRTHDHFACTIESQPTNATAQRY
jgi:hypothetical protein